MRARLVRMEPGYRGRQRIVIEIAGDFREQFDQLQGALLEVQITRAIPRRSLASNNYFHALVSRIASTVWGEFDEIKSDLVVEYGTPCLDKAGQVVMVDLPEGTDPHSYEDKTYEQLTLDFGSLTGRDFMAIDREVREREGRVPIVPVYDTSFLMRMVCRASKEKIDYDTIVAAPFAEFNAIRDKARSFLLRTEM